VNAVWLVLGLAKRALLDVVGVVYSLCARSWEGGRGVQGRVVLRAGGVCFSARGPDVWGTRQPGVHVHGSRAARTCKHAGTQPAPVPGRGPRGGHLGRRRGEPALLVQQVQHAHLALDEVKHVLVVHKLDVGPVDALALVLGLLLLEHVVVEVLLQLLVGEVDAQLRGQPGGKQHTGRRHARRRE
jgi:hypothetical protein